MSDRTTAARPDPEARLWTAFATAGDTDAVCRSWLALQCRMLPGAAGGMLLLTQPGGPFRPVAVHPDASQDFGYLREAVEECVRTAAPVVRPPPHDNGAAGLHIAYPILADDAQPVGVVALDLLPRPEAETKAALRALHWGVGWLEAQALRDRMGLEKQRVAGAAAALDIVAVASEHDRLEAAAMAVANEMATRLGAARVAVGLDAGRGIRLLALSHTAWFKRNTAMVAAIEQAMDEAAVQRATIRVPAGGIGAARIAVAHEALAATWHAAGAFTSFPLLIDKGAVGAITVVHDDPPPDAVVRLGEAISALLGPILDHKRRARRLISGRLADGAHDLLATLAGPRHLAWKMAGAAALACVTLAMLLPSDFRVAAKAVLEGRVQRAVPAPFDGFIATASVKAGDAVHRGDVLATMDDHDLQLDRVRWQSERQRLLLKIDEATSKHDPGTIGQLQAELSQADAQAALTAQKLARAQITAPIDGLVVSGDLSQSIGAPVETGKVLFEVAPLDEYRVNVRVDEHDIGAVKPGQTGQVLLHGMTGAAVPFTVQRVTSVAEADAGHNTFRIEGALSGAPASLRPGMEGVGKITVGRASYAWIWTRGIADWFRMLLWSWTP